METDKIGERVSLVETPAQGPRATLAFQPGNRRLLTFSIATFVLLFISSGLAGCNSLSRTLFPQEEGPDVPIQITVYSEATPGPVGPASAADQPMAGELPSRTGQPAAAPTRDLRDLALRLRPSVQAIPKTVSARQYAVGDRISFWASNVDSNEQFQVEAELLYKNDVVYVWAESDQRPNLDAMTASADNFAQKIYPLVRAFFGTESTPGIDSDPGLHILHATGLGRGIAGYFSSADAFSSLANPYSNQKDMFYISLDWLSRVDDYIVYESVLAHEFQHMVHWNNDRNEESWVNEGMSELAQEIAGYPPDTGFARVYVSRPDTQLNTWNLDPNDNGRHYGAAYLFMAYFLQRFGEELTSSVVSQPANGIEGFTAALQEAQLDVSFEDLFADWAVANFANEYDALGVQGVYGYRQLQVPQPTLVESFRRYPREAQEGSVRNFGVDYIALQGRGDFSIHFQGSTDTRFADMEPYGGGNAWWSNRADDSDMRLTRAFDFSAAPAGENLVMDVRMWYDIEKDYDYGYVLVSSDGRKWDILRGQSTTADNPSGNSFGHAYTAKSAELSGGEAPRWVLETFDLRAYAGEEVLVRFEYVTDDAVNAPGWFIGDVTIPAIGYAADFENGANGWESEGWLLTDNRLDQEWLVQTMAFDSGELRRVVRVPVGADGAARIDVDGLDRDGEIVLAISGLTPVTTEEALYSYRIEQR